MSDLHAGSRSARLDKVLGDLLTHAPELEAAAVVSFDGLPMASALPEGMDEDRVAAMSAALLSLGERAAEGLGRGNLTQVYVEGETGTVFLISADDEAVLVAVAARGAKAGLMLFEVRRAALAVAAALRADDADAEAAEVAEVAEAAEVAEVAAAGDERLTGRHELAHAQPVPGTLEAVAQPGPTVPAPATPEPYAAPALNGWGTYVSAPPTEQQMPW
jgi:hypothetical protein